MNRTIAFDTRPSLQGNWSFPYHSIVLCRNTTNMTLFLVTSYSLEALVGVLGNVYFICVLVKHKEKTIVTNIFITNLVASDLIMCIFCLPFTIVTVLLNYWLFGEAMCRMTSFIQCASMTVSVLSLVFIAVERHQLITNPTHWRPTLSQAYMGIAIIWMFACLLSLPFLTNSTLSHVLFEQFYIMDPYASNAICMYSWPSEEYRLTYATLLLLLQYCIPLLVIGVCYMHIYLYLQKREGKFEKHRYGGRTMKLKQINILLSSMVVAFAVCWLPLHVFNSIDDWNYKIIPHCLHDLIFSLCHLVAMASACINPIIYGFLNKNFKKEVKILFLNCQSSSIQEHENMPLSTMQTEVSRGSLGFVSQQSAAAKSHSSARPVGSLNSPVPRC